MTDEILTVPEVASLLKMTEGTVWRLCREKKIPHKKVGRSYRFVKSELERWLKEGEQ